MKRLVFFFMLLLGAVGVGAQEFIGCRIGDGWAETPMLRKTFSYDGMSEDEVSVWVTSLGYHELYINGTKVGDYVMQPAVSQLDKRAQTVCYNITKYLKNGENEIMIWVGQGWGRIYGTPATVCAQINWWSLPDMAIVILVTDSSWEASPSGYSYTGSWQPMQFGGERYDARVQPVWRPASVFDAKDIVISSQEFEGNRVIDTVVVQWTKVEPDDSTHSTYSTLLDFGRVITGWYQAMYRNLTEGQVITYEYLDHLDAKPPFTETDTFIAKGTGLELFTNRFHMHTFRYVRVRGRGNALSYSQALQISAVDPDSGATFVCSDPRLNAIHDMVKYTLSCLTFSGYMVDCPHIERMGYGGDGNSSTMTLQTLWDVRDIYRNWMQAWSDAMDSTGDLPYVAPAFRTGGGPYWSGFIIKAPWRTYLNYGDRYLIVEYYRDMCRWLDFIERHSEDYILQPLPDTERHAWSLGDWLAPEGVDVGGESAQHVSNCFLSECLADMVQMANLLHRDDDAERFAAWRQNLNRAIHRHFYHPESHTYANGTPLDQAYALLMDIPPDDATRRAVRKQLLKDIHRKYRDHIAVGLVGVPVFTEWCIREHEADLMATILRQPDYPGYLQMMDKDYVNSLIRESVHHDAPASDIVGHPNTNTFTTWESWDCGRPGKEDRSRVHNCYNGIGIWFYQALAGIRPDPEHPGYKHFFIDPQPVKDVDWVRATKPTPYGVIRVEIKKTRIKIEIPEGTTATVFPGTKKERTVSAGCWEFELK